MFTLNKRINLGTKEWERYMIREVKVNYAIGCVYNDDKEVLLFPGLSRVWKNEEFNINKEFNWISK